MRVREPLATDEHDVLTFSTAGPEKLLPGQVGALVTRLGGG